MLCIDSQLFYNFTTKHIQTSTKETVQKERGREIEKDYLVEEKSSVLTGVRLNLRVPKGCREGEGIVRNQNFSLSLSI